MEFKAYKYNRKRLRGTTETLEVESVTRVGRQKVLVVGRNEFVRCGATTPGFMEASRCDKAATYEVRGYVVRGGTWTGEKRKVTKLVRVVPCCGTHNPEKVEARTLAKAEEYAARLAKDEKRHKYENAERKAEEALLALGKVAARQHPAASADEYNRALDMARKAEQDRKTLSIKLYNIDLNEEN